MPSLDRGLRPEGLKRPGGGAAVGKAAHPDPEPDTLFLEIDALDKRVKTLVPKPAHHRDGPSRLPDGEHLDGEAGSRSTGEIEL